ncbi:MAG TPA: sulfatase [Gemmatimonadaceae bacterium]|nr:sulfatase [Gemmatimonadaceae bacterium]
MTEAVPRESVAKVSRRDALKTLGALAALGVDAKSLPALQPGRAAPNIVFIMTDDQRHDALSSAGNTILKTPNIDRLATEGVRFVDAFVTNALCAPSRATILTGLYSHAHGVITNGGGPQYYNQPGLPAEQVTFVDLLREAGYHTALIGKWHLRSDPRGFDRWVVFPGQGAYHDPEMIANGVRLKLRGHADDVVGDQGLLFLRDRPRDRPFCLLYQFKSPHRSWMPAERFARMYEDIEIPLPRTFEDKLAGRPEALRRAEMAIADMPDFRDRGVDQSLPVEERKRLNLQHLVKNYYRVLLSVDENVGRLLDALDRDGLAENTIVIYTSDNGFFLGEHGLFDKRLMYEPSIRVPMLVRFPARARKGTVDREHMVLNTDVAPTLLELAGVPVPGWMHGRSMVPILTGQPNAPWRDAFLYEYYEYPAEHCARKHRGVRTARWKLIHFWEHPEEWELYDLANDPDEVNNLAGRREHARTIRELRARLESLRDEVDDEDPPGPRPVAAPCGDGVNTGYGPP